MKTNLSSTVLKRLEEISKNPGSQQLIDQFKMDYPDNLDWLDFLNVDEQVRADIHSQQFPNISGYEFIKSLGSGANGRVYLARSQSDNTEYAIKVPLQFLDQEQIQRFRHEVRLLSSLSHENIASVVGSGELSENNYPYIVMEYINGSDILNYCRSNNLSRKEIISLFFQVLDAIQYAHTKGIVHRDIKPENILVTSNGQVKLLDFGIALATSNSTQQLTQLTKTGQIVGTLPYMSPEQVTAQNNLDTRADIYSLGVVLYQLLSGSLPFKLESSHIFSAISKIIEDLPVKISTFDNSIDSDLATIVHHAIEKKADERYQSPREFKTDLIRWMNDEPVSVRHHTIWYLLKHISRKHKALMAGSILAVMGLVTGLVFAVSFAMKEQQARKVAEINATTSKKTVEFINQIFASADPDNIYGEELTVLQLIDNAEKGLQNQLEDEAEVEINIRTTIASVYAGIDQLDKAQKQVDLVNQLLTAQTENPDYLDYYFAINFVQSKINLYLHKTDENISLMNQLIEKAVNHSLERHEAQTLLGNSYLLAGDMDHAKEIFEKIQDPPVTEDFPADHVSRLFSENGLAQYYEQTGDFAKAREIYQKNLQRHIDIYGENHKQTLTVLNNLATVEQRSGNSDKAKEILHKVILGKSELLGEKHISTLTSQANLLAVMTMAGEFDEAIKLSETLLDDLQKFAGPLHPRTLNVKNMRAYILEETGQLQQAEKVYRATLADYITEGNLKGPDLLSLKNNLAMLLMKQNKFDESGEIFRELLENVEEYLGKDHIYYSIFIGNYGELLLKEKKFTQARPLLEQSYEKIKNTFGENHKRTMKAKKRLEQLPKSD